MPGKVHLTAIPSPVGVYSYLWSDSRTTDTINVEIAGSYSVTVTNNLGCTANASIPVSIELARNGNFNLGLTSKWNITINTGYDFRIKGLAYTDIVILRDLHCWQMRIQVAPGRFYAIQINAKANILNDMELKKRKYYGAYNF